MKNIRVLNAACPLSWVFSCSCRMRKVHCAAHHSMYTTSIHITSASVGTSQAGVELCRRCFSSALPWHPISVQNRAQEIASCTTASWHLTYWAAILMLWYCNRSFLYCIQDCSIRVVNTWRTLFVEFFWWELFVPHKIQTTSTFFLQ